ncbi:MAG TPA: DNRLRE domain-containing protein [Flavisolibacter sp.]|jgi:hypothetical protein|nr:DNRLRE domain-containing protein [Flavisolibacter sp.]
MTKSNLILSSLLGILITASSCQKDNDAPENKVPIANAGTPQTVTLPTDSVTLTGSGADADGKVIAYLWSQVSGTYATTIVNPGSASTKVKGLRQGKYVFQLMVTDDKGATGVANDTITVNAAPIQTLTLQPSNNPTDFYVTNLNGQDISGAGRPEISIATWTSQGQPWTLRALLKFDLNNIPANANIISANLYLYSNPTPLTGNLVDANFGTNNTMLVQQIVTNWSPLTTNWFNQPVASATNQVVVPTTTQSTLDLNLDVTSMVASMVNGNANYGFFLRLQNEAIYNSRIFVSSYNTTYPAKRPKLVVVYQ